GHDAEVGHEEAQAAFVRRRRQPRRSATRRGGVGGGLRRAPGVGDRGIGGARRGADVGRRLLLMADAIEIGVLEGDQTGQELREQVDGKVIVRTGRRLPGVSPVAGVHHPISIVRMAVEDAYGAAERREGSEGAPDEVAYRTERITRSTCRAVAEFAFRTAAMM